MKYGIYYAYWEKEWAADYTQYVKKAEKLGFDILEIGASPLPDYSQEQIRLLRQCAKDSGVTLTAGYGPTFEHNMGSSDPAIREKASEWFKRLFEVMGQLEISKIGGALYSYWPVDFSKPVHKEDDWKYSVEGMKKLSELAKPYQITLNLEVLNRFENPILNTAEEGVQFVTEVDRDNVKVMLDTFHMNIEETSISAAIRTAGNLLGHFHTGECNRMVPGQGRMPWREIAEALHEIQYDGSVVMEPFVRRGGQIEKDIHIWRNMKTDISEEILDRDARNALLFEKYLFEQ
ncbi:sugar phosphate isomerase/epimerase [Clostridiaceae bacterium Marseille-Q4145]|nr:sugar phosphate isomerase/epimerase [Clostridiaceae bacterium Marseille-Q4145]